MNFPFPQVYMKHSPDESPRYKSSGKFKIIEIILGIFSDHDGVRLMSTSGKNMKKIQTHGINNELNNQQMNKSKR